MLEKIKYFLPPKYKNDELAQAILLALKNDTDEIKQYLHSVFNRCSASTSDREGIVEWEKELAITPRSDAELALRLAVVRSKLMRPPTMIPERFIAIVNCFLSGRDAKLWQTGEPYTIGLRFQSSIIGGAAGWAELSDALNTAKPAHLALNARLEHESNLAIYTGIAEVISGESSIMPAQPDVDIDATVDIGIVPEVVSNPSVLPRCLTDIDTPMTLGHCYVFGGSKTIYLNSDEIIPEIGQRDGFFDTMIGFAAQSSGTTFIEPCRQEEFTQGFVIGLLPISGGTITIAPSLASERNLLGNIGMALIRTDTKIIYAEEMENYGGI